MILVLAAARASAAQIEKVLTFPQAQSVRVVCTLSSEVPLRDVQLSGRIVDASNRELWRGPLGAGSPGPQQPSTLERSIEGLKPQLWSPATPVLYELTVTASQQGRELAQKKVRFGFRSFTSENGQFHLNGKPIFLRGLAINPPGRTIPEKVGHSRAFAQDYVRFLKQHNLNIIRLEPASQVWFDVCDELGMMVFQGPYGAPPTGDPNDPPTKDSPAKNFDRSIEGYKQIFEEYLHHPSIVIYVMSNELPYTGSRGEAWHDYLTRAHARLKEWYPEQLFIGNAGYGEGREGDINDVHRYWGWYYNTFLTYYNLRDPKLFGEVEKNQPLTFSECVGAFTGPLGSFNLIERKQLGAQLNWTGYSDRQVEDAQAYQAFIVKHATESFRRMRPINHRLSGIMPFTIAFHHWRGIESFQQMKPTAGMKQFGVSYQPVLLSWEMWTPQVYAGTRVKAIAHVINDADDFADLQGATLSYALVARNGRKVLEQKIDVPKIAYYGAWQRQIEIDLPGTLGTGDYLITGQIAQNGRIISSNETPLFVAGREWKKPVKLERPLQLYDPSGETAAALKRLGISATGVDDPSDVAAGGMLIIGENAWNDQFAARVSKLVQNGGTILCLAQEQFDPAWLPARIEMLSHSTSLPQYLAPRPTRDHMHLNPQRPDHPALEGLPRERLRLWSDYTGWDQTKEGFPSIYPVTRGFRLLDEAGLKNTAILIDYDRGLEGIALCEMFDGSGSIILTGLDLVARIGLDPAADRMLANLVGYASSTKRRDVHQLVQKPIKWGDYATMRGVLSGPVQGLFINTRWVPPPTEPNAPPLPKSEGAWNTRPGDPFVPHGVRPRGPFTYTNGTGPRDLDRSDTGSGIFYVRIPVGRRMVMTKVENPTSEPATLTVEINGSASGTATQIAAGGSATIRSRIPSPATELSIRYTGHRQLVITETSFE